MESGSRDGRDVHHGTAMVMPSPIHEPMTPMTRFMDVRISTLLFLNFFQFFDVFVCVLAATNPSTDAQ